MRVTQHSTRLSSRFNCKSKGVNQQEFSFQNRSKLQIGRRNFKTFSFNTKKKNDIEKLQTMLTLDEPFKYEGEGFPDDFFNQPEVVHIDASSLKDLKEKSEPKESKASSGGNTSDPQIRNTLNKLQRQQHHLQRSIDSMETQMSTFRGMVGLVTEKHLEGEVPGYLRNQGLVAYSSKHHSQFAKVHNRKKLEEWIRSICQMVERTSHAEVRGVQNAIKHSIDTAQIVHLDATTESLVRSISAGPKWATVPEAIPRGIEGSLAFRISSGDHFASGSFNNIVLGIHRALRLPMLAKRYTARISQAIHRCNEEIALKATEKGTAFVYMGTLEQSNYSPSKILRDIENMMQSYNEGYSEQMVEEQVQNDQENGESPTEDDNDEESHDQIDFQEFAKDLQPIESRLAKFTNRTLSFDKGLLELEEFLLDTLDGEVYIPEDNEIISWILADPANETIGPWRVLQESELNGKRLSEIQDLEERNRFVMLLLVRLAIVHRIDLNLGTSTNSLT
eukprot:gb/GECH01004342.1/.p1 GENE.gb/GECH01004342.1/~~gb/GECH01004342.1/.p1  ORF type:complete len:505 (+),score=104.55 gb/GECH01004342.1/:1-1515(+)